MKIEPRIAGVFTSLLLLSQLFSLFLVFLVGGFWDGPLGVGLPFTFYRITCGMIRSGVCDTSVVLQGLFLDILFWFAVSLVYFYVFRGRKTRKVLAVAVVSLVVIFLSFIFLLFIRKSWIPQPQNISNNIIGQISVFTDKVTYKTSESVNVVVKNNARSLVYYTQGNGSEHFCQLEQYKEGKWERVALQDIGKLYERTLPLILQAGEGVGDTWGGLPAGRYRFLFYYGDAVSSNDPYSLESPKTAISNEIMVGNF